VPPTLGIFPGRTTFVVDPEGIVRHVFTSQLRPVSHVDRALAIVRQIEREGVAKGRSTARPT
jgi:peroxiredoxin Q/BCP